MRKNDRENEKRIQTYTSMEIKGPVRDRARSKKLSKGADSAGIMDTGTTEMRLMRALP